MNATLIITDDTGQTIRTARVPFNDLTDLVKELVETPINTLTNEEETEVNEVLKLNNKLWGQE